MSLTAFAVIHGLRRDEVSAAADDFWLRLRRRFLGLRPSASPCYAFVYYGFYAIVE